ncbi:MAG: phage tail length tape measure family protein [Pseudomonadota bacterium]
MERLGIIVAADGTLETTNGIKLVSNATKDLAKELDTLATKQDASAASSAKNAQALGNVGRELASGNFKTAAAEAAQMALSSEAMTLGLLGAGAVVGGVVLGLGALAVAAMQGAREEEALNDSLLLTGNYAGLIAGELDLMASSIARNVGGKVSESTQILAGLVGTGKFTVESLNEVATAAQLVERYSGQTSAQVIRQFDGMADGAAKWAAKTNESYHFLTFEQYKYIEQLEKQGRTQEAARVTAEALTAHLGGTMTQNLGIVARSWANVANWADRAWAAMMNVGKTENTQDRLNSVNERLAVIGSRQNSKGMTSDRMDQLRLTLQGQRAELEAQLQQEKEFALKRSQQEQQSAKLIAEAREKEKKGRKGAIDREPEAQRRLIAENAGLSPSFAADWDRLTVVQQKNGLTVEWLTEAQAKLLAKQPAMRQAAQEQAALDRAATQEQEAKARATEQYLATLERENETLATSNDKLREQGDQAGLTKVQIGYLKAARMEDTIAQEKANLATAEASGADERRLKLMREHIQLLQDQQTLTREVAVKTATADATKKQEEASKKYGEDIRRDLKDGLIRGFEAGKSPAQALADTVGNMIKQRLVSAFVDSIMGSFEPLLKQVMANLPGMGGGSGGGGGGGIGGFLSSIFGSGGSAPGVEMFIDEWAGVGLFHSGGMAGATAPQSRNVPMSMFRGAQRFHGGGLASDERPVIVRRNEGIFTPEQMANLAPAGGGAAPIINIYTPEGMKAETRQKQNPDGSLTTDVIISRLQDAMADQVSAGQGSLFGAISQRFGVNTAVN